MRRFRSCVQGTGGSNQERIPEVTIAIIIVVCIVLAILAFLLPRLSRHPAEGRR